MAYSWLVNLRKNCKTKVHNKKVEIPYKKIQDRILLRQAILEKNSQALAHLHKTYYLSIKRYVASRINSNPDIEDLVQNVFLELCKSNDNYKGHHNAEAYLIGIAKNLIALYYRNKGRQIQTISIESIADIAADIQQKKTEQLLQQELQDIKDLITRLPPTTRKAISLRLIEGFSTKKTAELMGCSTHTVCQKIYEAKKSFKKLNQDFNNTD
jgi:RNA polymerase sigma-70 factor (ECF subfamily)